MTRTILFPDYPHALPVREPLPAPADEERDPCFYCGRATDPRRVAGTVTVGALDAVVCDQCAPEARRAPVRRAALFLAAE